MKKTLLYALSLSALVLGVTSCKKEPEKPKEDTTTVHSAMKTLAEASELRIETAGTYSSIAAEVGDLFIYSDSWTLIPSGDDGNVYVGDSKSSKFAAKNNNIVVAVGD